MNSQHQQTGIPSTLTVQNQTQLNNLLSLILQQQQAPPTNNGVQFASVPQSPTASSFIPCSSSSNSFESHSQQQHLSEACIELALQKAAHPLGMSNQHQQPSSSGITSTPILQSILTTSNQHVFTPPANPPPLHQSTVTPPHNNNELLNYVQSLANQTANIQSILTALLAKEQQQQQQQPAQLGDSQVLQLLIQLLSQQQQQQQQVVTPTATPVVPVEPLQSLLHNSTDRDQLNALLQQLTSTSNYTDDTTTLNQASYSSTSSSSTLKSYSLHQPSPISSWNLVQDSTGTDSGIHTTEDQDTGFGFKRMRVGKRQSSDVHSSPPSSPESSSCQSPMVSRSPIMINDSDTQMSTIRRDCGDLWLGSASEDDATNSSSYFRTNPPKSILHYVQEDTGNSCSPSSSIDVKSNRSDTTSSCNLVSPISSDVTGCKRDSNTTNNNYSVTRSKRLSRVPALSNTFPSKHGPFELIILNQPEQHHRARYMTEGSRGSVKDRSQQCYPTVQLIGWNQPVNLLVFVGTDFGKVKPHGYYQACKVAGKSGTTDAEERQLDGTTVISLPFDPQKNMIINVDCVGILKLRNADVELRGSSLPKARRKSTKARLVFRVNLPVSPGNYVTLQAISDAIICTQPIGCPEIHRISLLEGPCHGNLDMFVIGKNFTKGTRVLFQEVVEGKGVLWEAEAHLEADYATQTHLICRVPPYSNPDLKNPLTVQVVLSCGPRLSTPFYFTYRPAAAVTNYATPSNTDSHLNNMLQQVASSNRGEDLVVGSTTSSLTCVSPMAAKFNQMIEQTCREMKPASNNNNTNSFTDWTTPVGNPVLTSSDGQQQQAQDSFLPLDNQDFDFLNSMDTGNASQPIQML